MGCIYIIKNKINNKAYIGQTTYAIQRRFYQHIYNAKNNRFYNSSGLYNAINKYGEDNFYIQIIEDNISTDKLDDKEIFYIKEYNTISPNGYNISIGGHPGIYPIKPVYKIKLLDLSIDKKYKTPSEACKDNGYSIYDYLYHKATVSLDGYMFIYEDEYKNKNDINDYLLNIAQPICQLDKNGMVIGYYRSLKKAGEYTQTKWTNIRSCCQNNMLSTNMYQWCYYEDILNRLNKTVLDMSTHSIEQISMDGDLINIWDEAKNAAVSLNIKDGSSISKCCKNKQKTAYGYIWKFHNEKRRQQYAI